MVAGAAGLRGRRPRDDHARLGARHPHEQDRTGALMSIGRVTQTMMSQHALDRAADRPPAGCRTCRSSCRPAGSSTGPPTTRSARRPAMRLRASLADAAAVRPQRRRRPRPGSTRSTARSPRSTDQVRRARELALQGANSGAMGPEAREALASRSTRSARAWSTSRTRRTSTGRSSAASPPARRRTTADRRPYVGTTGAGHADRGRRGARCASTSTVPPPSARTATRSSTT